MSANGASPDRFAIIPIFPGERPPANNIAHGSIEAVMGGLGSDDRAVRVAVDMLARADAVLSSVEQTAARDARVRDASMQTLLAALDHIANRLTSFEARAKARAKAEADAEAERPNATSLPFPILTPRQHPHRPATFIPCRLPMPMPMGKATFRPPL
jgi:hypothetical protein